MKKLALITGGTRGIGAAIADLFERQGYDLILTGTKASDVAERNKKSNRRLYVSVNFTEPESLASFLKFIRSLKRLDVCVNNAGINIIKPLHDVSQEDFDRLATVNLRAPYLISQTAARIMRRGGRILNIGSIWSVITKPGRTLYSASKAGVVGMTRAMAAELAPDGILVNCVSPGFTLTDLTKQSLSAKQQKDIASQIPMGRFAKPGEIAKLACFLCSEDNSYITGQNIVIDGGFSIT